MGESVCRAEIKVENIKQSRNVSLDILRILCMFLIVLGHSICHGKIFEEVELSRFNYYLISIIYTFLMVHVNCFVLISGYFLCKQEFHFKKALALWVQTFFWSLTIYFVLCAFGQASFSIKQLIKALLPFTQQRYCFVTTYLLMYFLVPFMNAAIRAMDRKQHATFLMIYFLIFTVLQNIVFWREYTAVNSRSPLFFVFLYMIAAYFRLYPTKNRKWLLGYLITCLFVTIWKLSISMITTPIFGEPIGETAFSSYNSVTMVIASVCLFKFFEELDLSNIKYKKVITVISSVTFGVYLIHENPECRSFLWQTLLRPARFSNNPAMILILIAISVAIFICCGSLEYCRQKLFKFLKLIKLLSL